MRCQVSSWTSGLCNVRNLGWLQCTKVFLSQASEPLSTFMDYCTYGHMIDNVVLIVTGTLHERDVQVWIVLCFAPGLSQTGSLGCL